MGFQKFVSTTPCIGLPGLEVNPGQAIYTAFNYLSDGTVAAGSFAFAVPLEGEENEMNKASAKGEAGAVPLGFVERNISGTLLSPLVSATNIYPSGCGLNIAIRGQFYAIATGAATEGQSVLCDPTTGEITYGTAGSENDTGWVVRLPAEVQTVEEGDLVIYENFGITVTAASASGQAEVGEAEVGEDKVG